MLIRNKKTGVVWEVGDPATLKRVKEQPDDYEEVTSKSKKKVPAE
ncbi:MAG: hypothetical protein PHD64_05890 [Mesotoga sp.]|nr:hypothetical protein [Mesotoga sp.]